MTAPIRIANCSGFYGDRFTAPREMLEGGPIDVLTGDYLAELTMAILWLQRLKRDDGGFAVTFLKQMEQVLGTAMDEGVKVVTNAGGLNPVALADKLRGVADELGVAANIVHIEGDDILDRLDDLQDAGHDLANLDTGEPLRSLDSDPVTANVYLGSWAIVEALNEGADVVVCPRVTDAALTVGPAAWHHGWERTDWDRLAAAVVAGHVIECGAQATGGNYAFFHEIDDVREPGFPLVEIAENGDVVVTKHEGTGGAVTTGTVTAQLLYEIAAPAYPSPDVTARFDTIEIAEDGPDRVRLSGVRGEPPPDTAKVCINYHGGYRNSMTFVLTGLDIDAKRAMLEDALWARLGGRDRFDEVDVRLLRSDESDPDRNEDAIAQLTVTVKDAAADKVGRAFSGAAVELALANYPGFFPDAPPSDERPYAVYWPALVPADLVGQVVVEADGSRTGVSLAVAGDPVDVAIQAPDLPEAPSGDTRRVPLGLVFGARSGDKGGAANCGVWARSDLGYAWLHDELTIERFRRLVPETKDLEVERYTFPQLRALNFVVKGLLGRGVMSSTRLDPQAKGLGEYLRAKHVDLPVALLEQDRVPGVGDEAEAASG